MSSQPPEQTPVVLRSVIDALRPMLPPMSETMLELFLEGRFTEFDTSDYEFGTTNFDIKLATLLEAATT